MKRLNPEILKCISRFEAAMRKRFLVKTIFFEKVFRGKGLEFDSYRAYTPEDDAGLIDWKASKRFGKPLLRQYIEERSLKIFFIVDVSDNMVFGSIRLKSELAAEISTSLAHLILGLGDSIGFALYNKNIVSMKMFSRGTKQFYIFAKELSNPHIYGGRSDLKKTLEFLMPYLKGASSVFIISDFIKTDKDFYKTLKEFAAKYETIGIMIRDPVDLSMPDLKREIVIEDPDTGRQLLINPSLIKHQYEKYAMLQKREVEKIFKNANVDLVDIYTNQDFVKPLVTFLKSRVERRKYILPKR